MLCIHTDFGAAPCFPNTGMRPSFSISSHPFPVGEGSCGLAFKDASMLHIDNCNDVNAVSGCLYKEEGVVLLWFLTKNLIPQKIYVISVRFHFIQSTDERFADANQFICQRKHISKVFKALKFIN